MDIETLAIETVKLLAHFLEKGGEAVSEEIGKGLVPGLKSMWEKIKACVKSDKAVICDFQKDPNNAMSQDKMRKELILLLEDDSLIRNELVELVSSARAHYNLCGDLSENAANIQALGDNISISIKK